MKPKDNFARVHTKLIGNKFYESCVFMSTDDGQLVIYKSDKDKDEQPRTDDIVAIFAPDEWSWVDYTSGIY